MQKLSSKCEIKYKKGGRNHRSRRSDDLTFEKNRGQSRVRASTPGRVSEYDDRVEREGGVGQQSKLSGSRGTLNTPKDAGTERLRKGFHRGDNLPFDANSS